MIDHAPGDELSYRILKVLEESPQISQRALADALDISVGKANYCLRAFIEKGLVKMRNFKNSANKRAYFYYLTPRGVEEKAKVTVRFLRLKMREYETLAEEMDRFQISHDVHPDGAGRRAGRSEDREHRMVRR